MRISFDPAKDASNRVRHGVSLALARDLDWDSALVWVDDRFEYEEQRMIALAPKTNTLYYVSLSIAATCEGSSARGRPPVAR